MHRKQRLSSFKMSQLAQLALSQLVIVDMQTKLADVMPAEVMQPTVKNCAILVQAAHMLNVPVTATEQYPQGLGNTIPELQQHLSAKANFKSIAKTAFSATSEPK